MVCGLCRGVWGVSAVRGAVCGVVCVLCACWCVRVGVRVGVCLFVWHAENLRVCIQHGPVCAFKTFPTHGGGEGRRGEEGRGGSSPVLLTKMAHVGLSLDPREVHQKQPLDLTQIRFESRSRTTCHRFLQSFALPDAVKLQS